MSSMKQVCSSPVAVARDGYPWWRPYVCRYCGRLLWGAVRLRDTIMVPAHYVKDQ